jgi:hypothetical protein
MVLKNFINLFKTSFSLRSFIKKYKGYDEAEKKVILKYIIDENPNIIEELCLVLKKNHEKDLGKYFTLLDSIYKMFENLFKELKLYNYELTYTDIVSVIEFSDLLGHSVYYKNRLVDSLYNNGLINDSFFDNLVILVLSKDKNSVYETIKLCLRVIYGVDDFLTKFMSNLSPKFFTDKNIAEAVLAIEKSVGSSYIKSWRKKKIIPDYYPYLIAYNKEYLLNNDNIDENNIFLSSLKIIDDTTTETRLFIKEIIESFEPKNNEDKLSIFFLKLIGSSVITEQVKIDVMRLFEYIIPEFVTIYSISYDDCFLFFTKNQKVHSDVKMVLLLSVLLNGITPTKKEIDIIIKEHYADFLKYATDKKMFSFDEYDPDMYTLYIKLNQGKKIYNDNNFKKWVKDWYIPHSKLKDDDFFTFSEQEQACYLNDHEKFKVENTSLGDRKSVV